MDLHLAPLDPAAGAAPRPAAPQASWTPEPAALLGIYRSYRRHQARELLSLVPQEALRPLYREASAAGLQPGAEADDPLTLLSGYAETLLPLPPFRVWCEDLLCRPEAHLDEPWMTGFRPGPRVPLLLDSREERLQGTRWQIDLLVHHAGEGWRGHLAFRAGDDPRRHRTGDILREPTIEAVGERFREFDRVTMEAFLRSVQP
jgi:hypothetical protein